MTVTDARALLGVTDAATEADIRGAFRAAARDAHPDAGGAGADIAALGEARDVALASLGMPGRARAGAPPLPADASIGFSVEILESFLGDGACPFCDLDPFACPTCA